MSEYDKRSDRPKRRLTEPPAPLDFAKLEAAVGMRFDESLRFWLYFAVVFLCYRYHYAMPPMGRAELALLRRITKQATALVHTLLEYRDLPARTLVSLKAGPLKSEPLFILAKSLVSHSFIGNVLAAAEIANTCEGESRRPSGRPRADDLRFLIRVVHPAYLAAGGKGGPYSPRFARLVVAILDQLGYCYQSRDAVAKAITAAFASAKDTGAPIPT